MSEVFEHVKASDQKHAGLWVSAAQVWKENTENSLFWSKYKAGGEGSGVGNYITTRTPPNVFYLCSASSVMAWTTSITCRMSAMVTYWWQEMVAQVWTGVLNRGQGSGELALCELREGEWKEREVRIKRLIAPQERLALHAWPPMAKSPE